MVYRSSGKSDRSASGDEDEGSTKGNVNEGRGGKGRNYGLTTTPSPSSPISSAHNSREPSPQKCSMLTYMMFKN